MSTYDDFDGVWFTVQAIACINLIFGDLSAAR